MQVQAKPTDHAFSTALQRILLGAAIIIDRRLDGPAAMAAYDEELADADAEDAEMDAWLAAGGDLLMGRQG